MQWFNTLGSIDYNNTFSWWIYLNFAALRRREISEALFIARALHDEASWCPSQGQKFSGWKQRETTAVIFCRLRNNTHPLFPKNSLVCELHTFSYIFTDLERLVCLFDLLRTPLKSQKIHC